MKKKNDTEDDNSIIKYIAYKDALKATIIIHNYFCNGRIYSLAELFN
jgi:hypothetical protein